MPICDLNYCTVIYVYGLTRGSQRRHGGGGYLPHLCLDWVVGFVQLRLVFFEVHSVRFDILP